MVNCKEIILRISSDNITKLNTNEVFVFGSNERGLHGAGAALYARQHFGAIDGKGFGLFGNSFAIPTKDVVIRTLPIKEIERYVKHFIYQASTKYAHKTFLVTEIGCGLANYTPNDIAPLFKDALQYDNIYLPASFLKILYKL